MIKRLAVWSIFVVCTICPQYMISLLVFDQGFTIATVCELGFLWCMYLIVIGLLAKILGFRQLSEER